MFEHAREYGLIYQSKPPYEVMKTNWLSFDEVLKDQTGGRNVRGVL